MQIKDDLRKQTQKTDNLFIGKHLALSFLDHIHSGILGHCAYSVAFFMIKVHLHFCILSSKYIYAMKISIIVHTVFGMKLGHNVLLTEQT